MKTLVLLLIVMFISVNAFAITVPDTVLNAFAKKFPKAENVSWEQEKETEYEASFVLNNIKCSANFTETGEWLETETQIGFEFLPKNIRDDYYSNFKDAKLREVNLIQTSKGARKYEIEYKKDDQSFEVLYDETGNQIKEDDKDND